MKKTVILLLLVSFCGGTDLSELEKDIAQTEERIEDLESKDSLTLEEEQELENLEEQFEELEELTDLNDPSVAKYLAKNEADPSYNPGKFLPRHCTYNGRLDGATANLDYEDVYYEGTPVLEVPFKDELILDLYPKTLGLYSEGLFPRNIVDYGGEHGEQLGEIICEPDWSFSSSFSGDNLVTNDEPDETKRSDFYGLSFYDRIFPFYSVAPAEQQGLWGQWIQAPDSHPYGPAGGSI